MASSSREAGINQADAFGSALPQRTFKVVRVPYLLSGHGICPGGLGTENLHACRLVCIRTAPCGLPWHVTLHPRLWFLQLENGVHYSLPQAVLSGNPPCPSTGAVCPGASGRPGCRAPWTGLSRHKDKLGCMALCPPQPGHSLRLQMQRQGLFLQMP